MKPPGLHPFEPTFLTSLRCEGLAAFAILAPGDT